MSAEFYSANCSTTNRRRIDKMSDEILDVVELEGTLEDVVPPPLLPRGAYPATVQEVSVRVSDKENAYYVVVFNIARVAFPPDFDPDEDDYPDGFDVYYQRLLVPTPGDKRTLNRIKKFYHAMGLDTNITSVDPNAWMGRSAKIILDHRMFQGEPQVEVKGIEASDE